MIKIHHNEPAPINNIADILNELKEINPEVINRIERRLDEWGKWYRQKDYHQLDFSSETMEYKMMKFGCLPNQAPGPKPSPVNSSAEEIEDIIRIMAIQPESELAAKALREYYLGDHKKHLGKAAKRMGVSRQVFCGYIKNACAWLTGWFMRELTSRLMPSRQIQQTISQQPTALAR